MVTELATIMDLIAAIQGVAIPPPGVGKDIQQIGDEPPASIGLLPAFVNLEDALLPEDLAHGHAQRTHRIWMHLLFAPADMTYAVRQRRLWQSSILSAFAQNRTMIGFVRDSRIVRTTSEPFEQYVAMNFLLEVETDV